MTETHNDVDEARRLAKLALSSYGVIEHRNGAMGVSEAVEALMIATLANMQATLALEEQLRIRNVIELAEYSERRFPNSAGPAGAFGTLFAYGRTPSSSMRVQPDIAEALRIHQEADRA